MIKSVRDTDGKVLWFDVDAGKQDGKRLRKRFRVGRAVIHDPITRRSRGLKATSSPEDHAYCLARQWEEKQRDTILTLRHEVTNIPIYKLPEAKKALEMLSGYEESLDQVVREWIQYKYVSGLLEPWTFGQAVAACIAHKTNLGVSQAHLKPLTVKLERIAQTFGNKLCDQITTEELEAYARERAQTPHTWRNYRRDLGIAFNFAVSRKRATHNPAKNMPKPQFLDCPPSILSIHDVTAFLKFCSVSLSPYIALGLFAGLRPFETTRVTPQDIDLKDRILHVRGKRSRSVSRRHVKISRNLADWIEGWKPKVRTYWNLRDEIQEVSTDSKVKLPPDVFRRSFCSYHLALHRNPGMTAHEAGHRDQSMLYRHYRDLVTHKAGQEYFSIRPSNLEEMYKRYVTNGQQTGGTLDNGRTDED